MIYEDGIVWKTNYTNTVLIADRLWPNDTEVTLHLTPYSNDADSQHVTFEKYKYCFSKILQNSLFIENAKTNYKHFEKYCPNIIDFAHRPVDQIVGVTMFCKLSWIAWRYGPIRFDLQRRQLRCDRRPIPTLLWAQRKPHLLLAAFVGLFTNRRRFVLFLHRHDLLSRRRDALSHRCPRPPNFFGRWDQPRFGHPPSLKKWQKRLLGVGAVSTVRDIERARTPARAAKQFSTFRSQISIDGRILTLPCRRRALPNTSTKPSICPLPSVHWCVTIF